MARHQYAKKRFTKASQLLIDRANAIISEYTAQQLVVNLRQVYYQFVARGWLPNTFKNYKKLGAVISNARIAGLIDWDAIMDQTRYLRGHTYWDNAGERMRDAARDFRTDKWIGQNYRVEVWVEKDALIGIVGSVCAPLDVDYFSCRGNSSQSAMHEAAIRLRRYKAEGQRPVVVYLGDHDPSGIDMTRDIIDRLRMFTGGGFMVKRVALTMDQVREFEPPTNPVKESDSRSPKYREEFGDDCWELDALDPATLARIIREAVLPYRDDRKAYAAAIWKERRERRQIRDAIQAINRDANEAR